MQTKCPKQLTVEMLANLEAPQQVTISSSGGHIAYNLRSDWCRPYGRWCSSIWLAETGKAESARSLIGEKSDTLYSALQFSPVRYESDTILAFLSDRAGKVANFTGIDVLHINQISGQTTQKVASLMPPNFDEATSKFSRAPDGRSIAYLSPDEKDPRVKARGTRIVNVESGKMTTIVDKECHIYDFAWSPDSRRLAFVSTKTPDPNSIMDHGSDIETIGIVAGQLRRQTHFPKRVTDLCWHDEDLWCLGQYKLLSVVGAMSLYGRKVDQFFRECFERRGSGESDTTSCLFPPGLISTSNGPVAVIQAALSHLICQVKDWKVLYDSEEHEVRSWAAGVRDGQTVVAVVQSTAESPPELCSIINNKITCLSDYGQAVRECGKFATSRVFHATAQDGTPLEGVLTTPAASRYDMPEGGWLTIIYNHGGPGMQSALGFDSALHNVAPWFASLGYAGLCPNYCGSAGKGDKFMADMLDAPGRKDYSDVIDMVRAGIAGGLVDEKRVGIGGWSYGGCLSYLAVTSDTNFHFAAAMYGAGGLDSAVGLMTHDTSVCSVCKMTQEDRRDTHTPVLVLHGEDDGWVQLSHANALNHGCIKRGLKCEMVIYSRERHIMSVPYERLHFLDTLERTERFYGEHLL